MCCAHSKMKVRKGLQTDLNAWCTDDSDRTSEPPSPPPPVPPPPFPPPSDWCSHNADGSGCAVGDKWGKKPPFISDKKWKDAKGCASCTGPWNPYKADGCCAYSTK